MEPSHIRRHPEGARSQVRRDHAGHAYAVPGGARIGTVPPPVVTIRPATSAWEASKEPLIIADAADARNWLFFVRFGRGLGLALGLFIRLVAGGLLFVGPT